MKKIIIPVLALLAFASCQTTNTEKSEVEARMLDVRANAHVHPLTVEVTVDKTAGRITDVWTYTKEDFEAMEDGMNSLRVHALYRSSQKHGADIIVAPMFNITCGKDGIYKVEIIGYPGYFDNWKSLDEKDSVWMSLDRFYKGQGSNRDNVDVIINYKQ